jgi:hypothetical protein
MTDPNPNPLCSSLYLYPHALSAGRFHPLFYYESLSGDQRNFSTFQVLLQILVSPLLLLLRDFLKADGPFFCSGAGLACNNERRESES